MSDMGDLVVRAILFQMIVCIIVAAAAAIGMEHLFIWLWHHVSLHWGK